LGATGVNGNPAPNAFPGSVRGLGGSGGNYIVGSPFVTWDATGTRQGGVA
jgi:hypothetical protein